MRLFGNVLVLLGLILGFSGCSSEPSDPQERKVWQQVEEQKLDVAEVVRNALIEKNKKGIKYIIDNYDFKFGSGAYRVVVGGDDFEMVDFLKELGVPIEDSKELILFYLKDSYSLRGKRPTRKGVFKLLSYGAQPTWEGFVLLLQSKQYSLAQAYIKNNTWINPSSDDAWNALYQFADYDTMKLAIKEKSSAWGFEGTQISQPGNVVEKINPIKIAAGFGNSDVIRFFVDNGGDVNYLDPLSVAASFDGNKIDDGIVYLIEHGAYVSESHIKHMGERRHKKGLLAAVKHSAAMKPEEMAVVAAYGGSIEALKYLKEKFNLNYADKKLADAAAVSGDTETFEYIASMGAPLNQDCDLVVGVYQRGNPPAYTASENGYVGILKSLHQHGVPFTVRHLVLALQKRDGGSVLAVIEGMSKEELNKFGKSGIYDLVANNEFMVVSKMIEHGFSVKGMKLLQVCYNNKFNKLAELLKRNGAV